MIELPRPNETELTGFNKALYLERMLKENIIAKYNIPAHKLIDMLLENYDSWVLVGKSKIWKQ